MRHAAPCPARAHAALVALALFAALTAPASAAPRVRDGFFLRAGLGPAFALGTLSIPAGEQDSRGLGVGTELSLGGTVAPGLVLGGATFPMVVPSPSYDGVDAGGQHVSGTGPFVDWYPSARGGWHLRAGLLLAAGYLDGGERGSKVGVGYGATLGGGYDAFVGDEWSLGFVARATAYQLSGVDDSLRLLSPALLAVATYH